MAVKFTPGWKKSAPDSRDKLFEFRPLKTTLMSMPTSVDLSNPSPGSPFDPALTQGDLGSCGPNSEAKNTLFRELIDNAESVIPSRLFMYYTSRMVIGTVDEDSGVDNRSMLKALAQYGYCDEDTWPYDTSKFTDKPSKEAFDEAEARASSIVYQSVPQRLNTMKACLVQTRRPFIFGFSVYQSMLSDAVAETGIVPDPTPSEGSVGGHDILFVGYNDAKRQFKFQNHWLKEDGTLWGDNGYGYLSYDYAVNPSYSGDFWTVTKVPSSLEVVRKSTAAPGPVQVAVDAIFAQVEASLGLTHPIMLWALTTVQGLVDNYLAQHNMINRTFQVGKATSPAVMKTILDTVFAALETQFVANPVIVMALQLANNAIDSYLLKHGAVTA